MQERASFLRAMASGLREEKEDLARLLSLESGKPMAEARGEIEYSATFFDWFAEEAPRAYGITMPVHDASRRCGRDGDPRAPLPPRPPPPTGPARSRMITIKRGVGVCALITPWNFPTAVRILAPEAPAVSAPPMRSSLPLTARSR